MPIQWMAKEQDTGSRRGDQQQSHEAGREGTGTRPSGTGKGDGSKGSDSKKGDKK